MTRKSLTSLLSIAAALSLGAATVFAGPLLGKGGGKGESLASTGDPAGEFSPPSRRGQGGFGGRGGGHHGPAGMLGQLRDQGRFWDKPELAEAIELTEDQIEALEASYTEAQLSFEAIEGSVRDGYKTLRETIETDEPDIVEVNEAIDAATDAQNEAMKILLGHRVVVKNVLTADQEEALREYRRDNFRERFQEIRERMGEFRGVLRDLLEDGTLSSEDWEQIDAMLENVEPERADRIREHIERVEEHGIGAPPPPRGPGGEGSGPSEKPSRRARKG